MKRKIFAVLLSIGLLFDGMGNTVLAAEFNQYDKVEMLLKDQDMLDAKLIASGIPKDVVITSDLQTKEEWIYDIIVNGIDYHGCVSVVEIPVLDELIEVASATPQELREMGMDGSEIL